jgi:hypothetical protein
MFLAKRFPAAAAVDFPERGVVTGLTEDARTWIQLVGWRSKPHPDQLLLFLGIPFGIVIEENVIGGCCPVQVFAIFPTVPLR